MVTLGEINFNKIIYNYYTAKQEASAEVKEGEVVTKKKVDAVDYPEIVTKVLNSYILCKEKPTNELLELAKKTFLKDSNSVKDIIMKTIKATAPDEEFKADAVVAKLSQKLSGLNYPFLQYYSFHIVIIKDKADFAKSVAFYDSDDYQMVSDDLKKKNM